MKKEYLNYLDLMNKDNQFIKKTLFVLNNIFLIFKEPLT
jgi:hypothetical protein